MVVFTFSVFQRVKTQMASCSFCKVSKDQLKSCVCGQAFYCSKECQVKDWKVHKLSCPPYVIRETPGKGRGLFATRKIKEGEVILEEYPFFTVSKESFVSRLACLLGETKAKILQLHDPVENLETLDSKTVEELVMKDSGRMFYKYKEAETSHMNKIFRIFCANGKTICGEEDLYNDTTERGLYHKISLINHACVPNANEGWVKRDFKRHQVRALMVIEKDQEITINYKGDHHNTASAEEFVFGSRESRQQLLLEDCGGFLCQCSECSLEGEDLEDNERIRAEIREKKEELRQLLGSNPVSKRTLKKAMRLSNERVKLVQRLDVRAMFVHEMIDFFHANKNARRVGISGADPDIYRQEGLKYAKICGDPYIDNFYKYIGIDF